MVKRRRFLTGIGQAGLLLPIYQSLERQAWGAEPPRRLVILVHPDGVNQEFYWPTGSGSNITFNSTYYDVLNAHKAKIAMWRGLRTIEGGRGSDGDHANGVLSCMTGIEAPGPNAAGGISVDQHIADELFAKGVTTDANKKALNLGVVADANNDHGRMFYDRNRQAVQPFNTPGDVITNFFGGINAGSGPTPAPTPGSTDSGAAKKKAELSLKILDATLSDIDRLAKRVPSAEKPKLEAQHQSLMDMRKSAAAAAANNGNVATPPVASALECGKPTVPGTINPRDMKQTDAITEVQMDVMVAAMACDLSRVLTLQWGNTNARVAGFAPEIGTNKIISKDLHTLSHMAQQENADPANDARWYACLNAYFAKKVAGFIDRLARIKEGNGTMLDYTCILWTSEFAQGTHNGSAPGGGRSNKVNHPTMFIGTLGSGSMSGLQATTGGFPRALQTCCEVMGVKPMDMAGRGSTHRSLLG